MEMSAYRIPGKGDLAQAFHYGLSRWHWHSAYSSKTVVVAMDTTLPSGPMGIIKFETHFKLQTPPASQAAHSIVSRSGWVRAPGILDGCSNSCPGIGYPMVAMRRKAASIWLRTKDEPVQILSKGFLLRSRRPDHSRSLIMEQLSAAGNAGSTSDLQATSHRNPTSSRATAVMQ